MWSIDLNECWNKDCELILTRSFFEEEKKYKTTKTYVSNFTLPLKRNEVKSIETIDTYIDSFSKQAGRELYQGLLDYVVIHEDCEQSQKIELVVHTNDGFSTLHWVPSFFDNYSWNEI